MTRKTGETVDEYLARRAKQREEQKVEWDAERLADNKRRDAERLAELQKEWPDHKVTAEGVHFKCPICDKKHIERYPETELCDKCKERQELERIWPTHRISKNNRVEFVCKQCGSLFYYHFKYWDLLRYRSEINKPTFCSKYCKWVSGLKCPPVWNREEWEKIEAVKNRETDEGKYSGWGSSFSENFKQASKEYELSDPQQDANQERLFSTLEEYFEEYEEPNRRLEAIHNLIQKLKSVANGCHVEIYSSDKMKDEDQKAIKGENLD